jgi:hypothetical protein
MRIDPPASLSLKHVVQAFLDLYFCLCADGTIVDYAAARDTDLYASPEAFLGKRMQDVLPPSVGRKFDDAIAQVLRSGSRARSSTRLSLPAPTFFQGHAAPDAPAVRETSK